MFTIEKFRERLNEFMVLSEQNATKLSENVPIDRSTLSKLLRGKHVPSGKSLFALVTYFNCSADYLLGLTEDYPENKTYPLPTSNFGERFRLMLEETKTSQYELTKNEKISGNLIYRWLHNQTLPNALHLIKLAEYMKTTVDCLIGRDN